MPRSALVSVRRHSAGFLEARPRPGAGRHGEVLANFLQSEVQADLATAQAFLDEIAAARRGDKPQPGGVGNAFSIVIVPTGALIRNAVLENSAPEPYSFNELQTALETWIAGIKRVSGNADTFLEKPSGGRV
jgi:hypothetical protein